MEKHIKEQFLGKLLDTSYIPHCEQCKKVVSKEGKFARVIKYTDILKVMEDMFDE